MQSVRLTDYYVRKGSGARSSIIFVSQDCYFLLYYDLSVVRVLASVTGRGVLVVLWLVAGGKI